jgi:hypothetical protein
VCVCVCVRARARVCMCVLVEQRLVVKVMEMGLRSLKVVRSRQIEVGPENVLGQGMLGIRHDHRLLLRMCFSGGRATHRSPMCGDVRCAGVR